MSALTAEQADQLAVQRAMARKHRARGRHWFLRGLLMFVVAVFSGYRGGSVNSMIGIAMVVLAALCFSLGRSMRRQATEMEKKIDLMAGKPA